MPVQTPRSLELLQAHVTLEWFLAGVSPTVNHKVSFLWELRAADGAQKRPLARVSSHVYSQRRVALTTSAAFSALVFTSMNIHVPGQVRGKCEALVTLQTLIEFVAVMSCCVTVQIKSSWESFLTDGAREQPRPRPRLDIVRTSSDVDGASSFSCSRLCRMHCTRTHITNHVYISRLTALIPVIISQQNQEIVDSKLHPWFITHSRWVLAGLYSWATCIAAIHSSVTGSLHCRPSTTWTVVQLLAITTWMSAAVSAFALEAVK